MTATQPKPFADISTIASDIARLAPDRERPSPGCITSRTNFKRAPSLPPGWNTPKSMAENPRASEQRDGQRVAERELHQRWSRGRKIVRAGFARLR